ncbi:hypothetical protein WMF38_33940 [Sorangium sp. So ce118]
MRHLLAALLVVLTFGCSIVDSGDRDELRSQIAAIPPAEASLIEADGHERQGVEMAAVQGQ